MPTTTERDSRAAGRLIAGLRRRGGRARRSARLLCAGAVVGALPLPGASPVLAQSVSPPATAPVETPAQARPCRRTEGPSCVSKRIGPTRLAPGESLVLDGRLDDTAWSRATFVSDFAQRDPDEGAPPTERTEVAFAYGDDALYVGARMHARDPGAIRAILARRDDGGDSERLIVSFDPYQNRRTAYAFAVTAAGGRLDWYTPRDDAGFRDRDFTFDPVWRARARIDSAGWTAEMEIPFSQLRFNQADTLVWGLNINRWIPPKNEDIYWIVVPKEESGWSSWFGDLAGLGDVRARRPVELTPYATSSATFTSRELLDPADPFREESETTGRVGGDLKLGIGPSLTLDATINPDFGQVEADPAEVNLSAFPTFFEERRPFFVEGKELLEAPLLGGSNGGRGSDGLFYSRRIGAEPAGGADGDFVDRPLATTILAAAKVTGRSSSGLWVGAMAAVTAEEVAATYDTATRAFGETPVEPVAGWAVASVQQEFGESASTAGLTLTAVRRGLSDEEPLAAERNREAFAGAGNWNVRLRGGEYELRGMVAGSRIAGTAEAMRRVQEFSSHYFQRPDADHLSYDPTRTSLSGYAAGLELERTSAEHWLWRVRGGAISPGFDVNDAGRLRRADRLSADARVRYRETTPGLFQQYSARLEAEGLWNYGGDRQRSEVEVGGEVELRSFWNIGLELGYVPRGQSDVRTRGGPSMGTPRGWYVNGAVRGPRTDRTRVNTSVRYGRGELGGWGLTVDSELELKPAGALQLSLGPRLVRSVDARQYVGTFEGGSAATFGRRYVFGSIDRTTLSMQIRFKYAFTPDLSLEGYAEPFAATGAYSGYGELEAARSMDLREYGTDGTTVSESAGPAPRLITVTDGDETFSFLREDFRTLSFRSNVVLRWEWRPGSTLFLVWELDRRSSDDVTAPERADFSDLWRSRGAPGRSFLAIKASYWIPI